MFFLVARLTTKVIELQEFEDFLLTGLVTNEGINKGSGLSFTLFLEMTFLPTLKHVPDALGVNFLVGLGRPFL